MKNYGKILQIQDLYPCLLPLKTDWAMEAIWEGKPPSPDVAKGQEQEGGGLQNCGNSFKGTVQARRRKKKQ